MEWCLLYIKSDHDLFIRFHNDESLMPVMLSEAVLGLHMYNFYLQI